jgi:hypothetical protein
VGREEEEGGREGKRGGEKGFKGVRARDSELSVLCS